MAKRKKIGVPKTSAEFPNGIPCEVPGCERVQMLSGGAKGMCPAHYKRSLRGVSFDGPLVQRGKSLREKFYAYAVQPENEADCWRWAGGFGGGLPVIGEGKELVSAGQVAWEIHHGRDFPEGLVAHRGCATNHCVNPAHMVAVPPYEHSYMCNDEGRCGPGSERM